MRKSTESELKILREFIEQLLRQFARRCARERYDVGQLRIINHQAKAILVATRGAR